MITLFGYSIINNCSYGAGERTRDIGGGGAEAVRRDVDSCRGHCITIRIRMIALLVRSIIKGGWAYSYTTN